MVTIFTASGSSFAHFKSGNVSGKKVLKMVPWVLVGTSLGGVLAHFLHSSWLSLFFAFLLLFVCIKTIYDTSRVKLNSPITSDMAHHHEPHHSSFLLGMVALGVSFVAGLIGIGGGVLFVPILVYLGFQMRTAVGLSATLTLPIAIIGSITFAIMGQFDLYHPSWSTGYIYWPAVICVAPLGIVCAGVGERLHRNMNPLYLKRVFALLLLCICASMLWHSAEQFHWISV